MSLHLDQIFAKHQRRLEKLLPMNENHYQFSIYDFIEEDNFLQEEKSQEVAPSETLPQVDEAQTIYVFADGECVRKEEISSSDLDTQKLINDNLVFNPEGYAEKVVELPTEDTDMTLFSVGDYIKVRQASELYTPESDPESYYFVKDREGLEGIILKSVYNEQFICSIGIDGEEVHFYNKELIKI